MEVRREGKYVAGKKPRMQAGASAEGAVAVRVAALSG